MGNAWACATLARMKAYRACLLYFPDPSLPQATLEEDGLLVVGSNAEGRQVVLAIGPYASIQRRFADVTVAHFPGRLIAPGFVDMHLHYPQLDVIGSPAEGLLP